jgi:hypothetical protein
LKGAATRLVVGTEIEKGAATGSVTELGSEVEYEFDPPGAPLQVVAIEKLLRLGVGAGMPLEPLNLFLHQRV